MFHAEAVFQWANSLALLTWMFLILFPHWILTRQLIRSLVLPAGLSLLYVALIVFTFRGLDGGFDSLAGVMQLFQAPWAVTAGWVHYLAFDLFVGVWIVNDSERLRISRLVTAPCLLLTFMLGPMGLALYLALRYLLPDSLAMGPFIRAKYAELWRRNPFLSRLALVYILLAIGALIGTLIDPRVLDGSSLWVKPSKFFMSLAIYFLTIAWFLGDLTEQQKSYQRKFATWTSWVGLVEMLLICLQAIRGVRSHYNMSTTFDYAVYMLMGIMIVLNLFAVIHLARTWRRAQAPSSYRLAASYGFLIFIVTGFLACYMSAQPWSRVGLVDTQHASLILGWNQVGGDLRISHFIGIHGLQVMLLLACLTRSRPVSRSAIHLSGLLYLGITLLLFFAAAKGLPLFAV